MASLGDGVGTMVEDVMAGCDAPVVTARIWACEPASDRDSRPGVSVPLMGVSKCSLGCDCSMCAPFAFWNSAKSNGRPSGRFMLFMSRNCWKSSSDPCGNP